MAGSNHCAGLSDALRDVEETDLLLWRRGRRERNDPGQIGMMCAIDERGVARPGSCRQ
jgi:hypothetical protein